MCTNRTLRALGTAATVVLTATLGASPAPAGLVAGSYTCNGLSATHVGGAADDTIIGTPFNDVIVGLGGNDQVQGLDGSDTICGGPGNDVLLGGLGNDVLVGDDGDDLLQGAQGRDLHVGGPGNDVIDARTQDNGVSDAAHGDEGNDKLYTDDGVGNDVANGGSAADTCWRDPTDAASSCELIPPVLALGP